jgi:DNA replication protein DnaC
LKRLEIRKNTPGGVTAISSSREPEPVCELCGGLGYLRIDVEIDDPRFGTIVPCECKEREISDRRLHKLLERSNLRALSDKTFDSYIKNLSEDPKQVAYQQALRFAGQPEGWFVLVGPTGTGKTHLAAAIGNDRLKHGHPALFMVVPDLLDHLRSAYAPGSEMGYDELFETVRDAPLLILDDLGAQISTQWASEKLFQLFNHRYIYRLATVVTSNNSLDEIGGRLASRMSDPALCTCVMTKGPDFRGAKPDSGTGDGNAPRGFKRRPPRGVEYTDLT